MKDLRTQYLGLNLPHPFIASAHPRHGTKKGLEESFAQGASLVVLPSIFEESIVKSNKGKTAMLNDLSLPEAQGITSDLSFDAGIDQYIDAIKSFRSEKDLPILASISCYDGRSWPNLAKRIDSSGVNGLEINLGVLPITQSRSPRSIEAEVLAIVRSIRRNTSLPIAVKISSEFTNIPFLSKKMAQIGIDALVCFNPMYRYGLNDKGEFYPSMKLSKEGDHAISLRYLLEMGISPKMNMCANGGIHSGRSAFELLAAGAHALGLCSIILREGTLGISRLKNELEMLMQEYGLDSLEEIRAKWKQNSFDIGAYTRRAHYVKALSGGFQTL